MKYIPSVSAESIQGVNGGQFIHARYLYKKDIFKCF